MNTSKVRKRCREHQFIINNINVQDAEDIIIAIFLRPIIRFGCFRRLFSAAAAGACLLLLFAFLSPPITTNQLLVVNTQDSAVECGSSRRIWKYYWDGNHQINLYNGCSEASTNFIPAEANTKPNRFLLVRTSGGLNQQRTGIIDSVVAAYILSATLVVPNLDQESFWKDASNFSDIFDMDWFTSYLSKDVRIVTRLPEEASGRVATTRVPRKCDPSCYSTRILPIFNRRKNVCMYVVQAVELTKFDYRLANQLDVDLQKLRCRVNYHALRFTDPIRKMGQKLVEKMRMKSDHFVALHLRFEPDMLAFSGCYYGGGDEEIKELSKLRKRWRTLHRKNPDKERRNGKCPLSPEEVGLMLRALGLGNDVHIYVASGQIYGGEEALAPLKALFPNFHTKETLATGEELAQFSTYSSRMAALDFIVSDESDVFVANNNGNMARMLAGRRKYFGHKPTIRPNARRLSKLFLKVKNENITWEEFALNVQKLQRGFMGEPGQINDNNNDAYKVDHQFHENPLACICKNS
ncbi:O-fucosyltransferase 16-like [Andrographis paniculata]|uniref:O-fucosyltransferase 16-like n=1 Tax=Andrographis paniculata TaxID=175694 RepID=UPI0021E7E2BD|nr:O-fucosyltransferase 16-like [Andrographis paniculata]